MHLSFQLLSVRLQVHCPFSASLTRISPYHRYLSGYRCVARSLPLRRASLLSTALPPATGALPALHLYDTHHPFPPLAVELQVRCSLPASPTRISPSTALPPATDALPALHLYDAHLPFPPLAVELQVRYSLPASPTRISPFQCSLSGYRCVARSLPL